jgi:hypothetical protein
MGVSGEAQTPELEAPELDAPELEAPELDAPELDAPELDAPELDAPELDAPELDAPELDAPELDAPELDAPPELEAAPLEPPIVPEPPPRIPPLPPPKKPPAIPPRKPPLLPPKKPPLLPPKKPPLLPPRPRPPLELLIFEVRAPPELELDPEGGVVAVAVAVAVGIALADGVALAIPASSSPDGFTPPQDAAVSMAPTETRNRLPPHVAALIGHLPGLRQASPVAADSYSTCRFLSDAPPTFRRIKFYRMDPRLATRPHRVVIRLE